MAEKGSRKDKNQNIQVFVRLRPLNQREKDIRSIGVVEVVHGREVVVRQSNQNSHTKKFTFDRAFPPQTKQLEIYQEVVSPLIEEVLAGYNCTVFAYGQTGTGKTHTMVGEAASCETSWQTDPEAGIIPRALSQLFDELRLTNTEYTVRVSYLELYNEELFDLLSTSEDNSKLRIYEDVTRKGSNIVNGLEEITVYNKNEVYKIMAQGQERKRVASTLMNAQSSRSHTVFTIVVHMKENSPEGEELVKIGKLNLVDLAGSENISKAGSDNPAKRERARECVNINQSLLTLGRVITALVERHPHIPYRESKLTRILQESLGGRTKTSIIATISPGHKDLEETMSTLEYANRAKNIQNKPEINQKMTKKAILKEYSEEIDRLKRDLQAARDKNGVYLANETYAELTYKQEEQRKEIQELILKKRAIEEERERAEKMFNDLNGQLFAERQQKEATYNQLCETQNKLDNTNNMLEKTRQHFEEQRHLVEKQQDTERNLSAQAQELLQVADVATNDANCLHDSVDKRRYVETTNLEVTRTYREMSAQHLSNIACRTQQHQSDINSSLLEIHNVASTYTNNNCQILMENQNEIEQLIKSENDTTDKLNSLASELFANLTDKTTSGKERMTSSLTSQSEGVHTTFSEFSRCLSVCLQRATDMDMCADLKTFLQYWHGDTTNRMSSLNASAGRWAQNCRDATQRHATVARQMADILRHRHNALAQRVHDKLDQIKEDKDETERRIAQQLSNIEKEKIDLEAQLAAWAEYERRELEQRIENYVTIQRKVLEQRHAERMTEIDEEQKWFASKVDSYVQWLNDTKAENEKEMELVLNSIQESEKEMENHRDNVERMYTECGTGNESVVTACHDLNVTALKLVQQVKDNFVSSIEGMQAYVNEETTKALRICDEKTTEATLDLTNLLDAHTQCCQQSVNALTQEMQSLTTNTTKTLSTLAANNNNMLSTTQQQQNRQDEALMTIQQTTQHYTECVTQHVSGLQQLENRCLQEQYAVYSPTGNTPARKEYRYPRDLAVTSPHERIIARYRAARLEVSDDTDIVTLSDSESTQSEDSAVAIQPPSPTFVQPPPIVKSTSEIDIFASRKTTQGKENMNRSMSFKKPSKLPSLSVKKTTPLIDKN
ncbi:kinesin-like protein Klp61F [Pieris rapae]|uniref:kinesin-like protein Klp61F n=1 Tax=Pieris rapae TaxID=64459 RepID=UPI001E27ABCA|nr:kinesin-like protein Klp61F [Pieris rapae]XP_022123047.2 kinesin-like protein Klp61F [Pieris rapae]